MEAALWSAIAVVAALSMGTLFLLVARIDGLGSRVDDLGSRVDGLGSRLDARIDALATRIDSLSADTSGRIDALTAAMTAGFDRVDDRLTRVERELQAHVDRHAS